MLKKELEAAYEESEESCGELASEVVSKQFKISELSKECEDLKKENVNLKEYIAELRGYLGAIIDSTSRSVEYIPRNQFNGTDEEYFDYTTGFTGKTPVYRMPLRHYDIKGGLL